MDWFKRERVKAGITLAGMLLLLVLMVWVPVSAASVQETESGLATPVTGMVQVTPTVDATMTALSKEKLQQEIKQLQAQNDAQVTAWNKEKIQHENEWLWNYGATIFSSLVLAIGGIIAFWRWRVDRRDAQDKDLKAQAEDRFKTAVTALGDEKEGAQVGGAILLRSFLRKGDKKSYERYHTQIFDLAVAYLRLPRPEDRKSIPNIVKGLVDHKRTAAPLPLTSLRQALIAVYLEAFRLVRDEKRGKEKQFDPQSLNATHLNLDRAFLWNEDLKLVWLAWASLRETDLSGADLSGAWLWRSDLRRARLVKADLLRADLGQDKLNDADLREAHLEGAILWGAHLTGANLIGAWLCRIAPSQDQFVLSSDGRRGKLEATLFLADLREAKLSQAHLRGADLRGADLSGADLSGAKLLGLQISGTDRLKDILPETKPAWAEVSQVKITEVSQVTLPEANRNASYWDTLRWCADLIKVDAQRTDPSSAVHWLELLPADLCGANLSGADLRGADLNGVIYNTETQWQGAQYNKQWVNEKEVEEKEEKKKVQPVNDEQGKPVKIMPMKHLPGFDPDKLGLNLYDEDIIRIIKTHPPLSQSHDVLANLCHLLRRVHQLLIWE